MRTCRRRRRRRSPLLMRVRAPGRAEAAPACSGAQTWPLFPTWAQKGRVKSEGNVLGTTQSSSCPWPEELPRRPLPLCTERQPQSGPAVCPRLMHQVGSRYTGAVCLAQPAWRRVTGPRASLSLTPAEGKVLSPPHPEVPMCREPDPAPALPRVTRALTLSSRPSHLLPLVIAVRVKEEHVDTSTPDKASSAELPVSIENIKQETD